jgi:hypothetical protein
MWIRIRGGGWLWSFLGHIYLNANLVRYKGRERKPLDLRTPRPSFRECPSPKHQTMPTVSRTMVSLSPLVGDWLRRRVAQLLPACDIAVPLSSLLGASHADADHAQMPNAETRESMGAAGAITVSFAPNPGKVLHAWRPPCHLSRPTIHSLTLTLSLSDVPPNPLHSYEQLHQFSRAVGGAHPLLSPTAASYAPSPASAQGSPE